MNQTTTPQKNTAAQKIASLITWTIILLAAAWYWLSPNKPTPTEPAVAPAPVQASEAPPPTLYTSASPQALASAAQYLADLDSAMTQGLQILQNNNLKDLTIHSQHFKTLRETGQTQFGRSVFEPLGNCAAAGIFANSWWQAQVITADQKGKVGISQTVQSHLDEFKTNRVQCLNAANPAVG